MDKYSLMNESFRTDFSITHVIGTPPDAGNFHFHDLYEMFFSMSDNIKCFINDRVYNIAAGDLILFSPHDFHKFVIDEDYVYERYILLFDASSIIDLSTEKTDLLKCFRSKENDGPGVMRFCGSEYSAFTTLLQKAEKYCTSDIFGADVYKKISLAEILLFINQFQWSLSTSYTPKAASSYSKISSLLNYINEHLNEDLFLDKLSETFFISKYYMETIFKAATGFSINEYIIVRRILKAKELLRNNITVTQAAEACGFNNYSHFIRTFKKLVGISPKQYTKKVQ